MIIIIPIGLYWYNFRDYELSKNPEDWGVFGDYIGGVYNVLTTVVLFFITYYLNKTDRRKTIQINAAEELLSAVENLETKKDSRSLSNLVKKMDKNKYRLPEMILDKLETLHNNMVEYLDKSNPVQMNLEIIISVKKDLSKIING